MQYCVQRRYLKRTSYTTSIQSIRCSLNFKNTYILGYYHVWISVEYTILLYNIIVVAVSGSRNMYTQTRTEKRPLTR